MRELELELECENDYSEEETDSDICDINEIDRLFTKSENVTEKVIAKNKYILHIAATCDNQSTIGLALSDNSCEVHNLSNSQVAHITTLTEHNDKIINCRFNLTDNNLLYTGSSDGSIKLWDLRTPRKSSLNFLDTSIEGKGKNKPFSCFDVSCNERVITAGTDLVEGDAYVLFWDVRNNKFLGGYWESHTDDITQLKFHPENKDKLISGSIDGLINIYDLSQSCEDDALIDTLNTQSSIEQLLWFNAGEKYNICCTTHTSDLQLWNVDQAEPYEDMSRADIAKEIQKKSEDYIYLAGCHTAKKNLLVLAGSNCNKGKCLRSLYMRNRNGEVHHAASFKENSQRIRGSWYNENTNLLLTGGEQGILNVWKIEDMRYSLPVKRKM